MVGLRLDKMGTSEGRRRMDGAGIKAEERGRQLQNGLSGTKDCQIEALILTDTLSQKDWRQ